MIMQFFAGAEQNLRYALIRAPEALAVDDPFCRSPSI
jgi:hypothetical protein